MVAGYNFSFILTGVFKLSCTPMIVLTTAVHCLQFGAKLDKPLDDGRTALTIAMETNNREMIETLLEASLSENYVNTQEFMYEMAKKYRRVDQG